LFRQQLGLYLTELLQVSHFDFELLRILLVLIQRLLPIQTLEWLFGYLAN
jgi:hypothetical protein